MTKDELENYARNNRARLQAQEVKIGDTVKVLIGQFAGECGVVVGIIACAEDYTLLYYEINMYCKVPDEYKCRQSVISPNNVIGGLSTNEFEVMFSFKPEKPTDEIKCGDIVRVKRETPRTLYNNLPYDMPFFVAEIERDFGNPMNDTFLLRNGKTRLNIHPHWLEKWDATKSKDNTITIPVKVDLDDTYWHHYRAELVRELAVKLADNNSITIPKICDCITDFATRIVDNLKKQSFND